MEMSFKKKLLLNCKFCLKLAILFVLKPFIYESIYDVWFVVFRNAIKDRKTKITVSVLEYKVEL